MRRLWNRAVCTFVVGLIVSGRALAQDTCDASLKLQQNTIVFSATESDESTVKKWFCDSAFEKSASNSTGGISLSVPIQGVPVSFGASSSDSNASEKRRQFCADSSQMFSHQQAMYVVSQVLPDQVRLAQL